MLSTKYNTDRGIWPPWSLTEFKNLLLMLKDKQNHRNIRNIDLMINDS